jgi:thioredoxin-related protein
MTQADRLRSAGAVFFALAALMLAASGPAGAAEEPAAPNVGVPYTLPEWFKPSFLDFRQDVAEARKQGRQVVVFFHLENCPFCARMLKDNFTSGANHDFIRKHFDVIAVDVRGSLEAKWVDGETYTERGLAVHLGVRGTPTLVFLDLDGKNVLQLAGYRDPRALRAALDYVQSQRYRSGPFLGGK